MTEFDLPVPHDPAQNTTRFKAFQESDIEVNEPRGWQRAVLGFVVVAGLLAAAGWIVWEGVGVAVELFG